MFRKKAWVVVFHAFLIANLLHVVGCGLLPAQVEWANSTVEQPIINGEMCTNDQFPSSVELLVYGAVQFGQMQAMVFSSYLCGGTLIAPDVVLTAAHCLETNGFTFGFGKIEELNYYTTTIEDLNFMMQGEGPMIPIKSHIANAWVQHPNYKSEWDMEETGLHNHYDIALIFLKKPMGLPPTKILSKEEASHLINGAPVTIVGWGQEGAEEGSAHGVRHCAKSHINEVGDYEFQVGSDEKSARKCFGDSGGATYLEIQTPDGPELRLIGVTSHAYDSSLCLKGGIDTRVDAFSDWVFEEMKKACDSGQRSPTFCQSET